MKLYSVRDELTSRHVQHADHSGGNEYLASHYGSELKMYGSAYEDCPAVTHPVRANDKFDLGSLAVEVRLESCKCIARVVLVPYHRIHCLLNKMLPLQYTCY